jgi:hypothetical protein
LTRLRLIIALAAMAMSALGLAACGGGDDSDESPQAVIENATFEGVDSGELDLTMTVRSSGKDGGDVDVSLSGPFQGGEDGATPQLDLDAEVTGEAEGDEIDFQGGLVLLPNSAYVNYEGTEYEVDPTTYSFVESALKQSQRQGGEGGSSACQEAASKLNIASFADNLTNDGTVDVGGTSTTKLSGDLDVSGALDSLVELSEDPACRSQLGSNGVPGPAELARAKDQVGRSVNRAHMDLYVGDDDIIRRVTVELDLEPKGSGSASQRVRLNLDLTLTGVNEEQEISAPGSAKPLSDLFVKLGVNPLELAGALQGEGLGGVLEGLNGDIGGLGGLGGGGSSGGGASGGGPQSPADCLRSARSAEELQKCVGQL